MDKRRQNNIRPSPFFVYLIECRDKSIYTGITTDVARRFEEHKNGVGGHYTRSHPVKKILYTEKYLTRSKALKREAEIKLWSRARKLRFISKIYSASFVARPI